ncbi:MAG: efflux RND transporter periplasmic adaptor subunit [Bacteroidota bacterium]
MQSLKPLIIILLGAILTVSCGGDGLEEKKAKLEDLQAELEAKEAEIAELEAEILELDPTFGASQVSDVLVATLTTSKEKFIHQFEVRGTVESKKNVFISAETMGRVERILVEEGQYVKAGATIMELDADVLRNNIAEIQTSLELAEAIFKRQANLWEKKIGTEVQYLQAKNNKETLERRLGTLQSQLKQYRVKAPFSGTLDDIPARVGEMAQPGVPLARIVNQRDMYINAAISEAYLGKVAPGDIVDVYFPIQDLSFPSKVSAVGRVINQDNRTFEIQIELPIASGYSFQPNQVTVLRITDYRKDEALTVPTRLIQADDEGKFVYVVENEGDRKLAKKARIETGLSFNSKTEILVGLDTGQLLIDKGYRDVNDGVQITLATASL